MADTLRQLDAALLHLMGWRRGTCEEVVSQQGREKWYGWVPPHWHPENLKWSIPDDPEAEGWEEHQSYIVGHRRPHYSSDPADCATLRKYVMRLPQVFGVTVYHREDGYGCEVSAVVDKAERRTETWCDCGRATEEEACARACYAALLALKGEGDA